MGKVIASFLTLTNLFFGLAALALTQSGGYEWASLLILAGMVVDALDGRVARLLHAESEFGRQLDSLSDVVTFGVAPAAIMYVLTLQYIGIFGILVGILFPACGVLRLARFNTDTRPRSYFVGLPITAAGGIVATMALCRNILPATDVTLPVGMVLLSVLMVSNVKYPNFKRVPFPSSTLMVVPVLALVVYFIVRYGHPYAGLLIFAVLAVYAGYGAWRFLRLRNTQLEQEVEDEDEEKDRAMEGKSLRKPIRKS
ncbi:MAG: CDP-diacylglycerol--serine O-phosphatidyltransferase [Alicyclobacillaceae bacterium]|nr:CDP-diacylglycerol--serine O-phosphatidyltransferase [Alicyclobacillaceae bacterium]